MKTFNVVWEEQLKVEVEAKSEEEAIEKVSDGDYDEGSVEKEVSVSPEAFELS